MKEIMLTCPFTGLTFKAVKDSLDNLYFKHPLTGEDMKVNFNASIQKYNVPKSYFKHIEIVSLSQAAEMLEVSRQRVSAIAASNVIKPIVINEQQYFLYDDVVSYRENRKVGAPRKDR